MQVIRVNILFSRFLSKAINLDATSDMHWCFFIFTLYILFTFKTEKPFFLEMHPHFPIYNIIYHMQSSSSAHASKASYDNLSCILFSLFLFFQLTYESEHSWGHTVVVYCLAIPSFIPFHCRFYHLSCLKIHVYTCRTLFD